MIIHTRNLLDGDYQTLRSLLENEAPNEWNYITADTITEQFALLKQGKATAALLEDGNIVGFSIMLLGAACPVIYGKYQALAEIAYIQDVAVSKNYRGQGFGSRLLLESTGEARKNNLKTVFLERHEENLASAGMMRKAGFEVVETFFDPTRRTTGSRRTTVLKKNL